MKILGILMICFSFLLVSCSKDGDDGGSNPLTPGLTGNQNNNSVQIEVSHLESKEYQNAVEFYFKPSANIKVSKVDVSVMDFKDELDGDNQTIYQAEQWYLISAYEGVEEGQKWSFKFTGVLAENNQSYTVTSVYTVNN